MNPDGPHRRRRVSLEGVLDLSSCLERPLSPGQHKRAEAKFYQILNQCERGPSFIAGNGYNRIKLIRLFYEYARSTESQWLVLQEFFKTLNIPFDEEATAGADLQASVNSFADYLMDNFFLLLKASATRTPQPSPANSSQPPSRFATMPSVDRVASLRRGCLIRDRHRCVISHDFNIAEAERRMELAGDRLALDDEGQQLLRDQDPNSFMELEVAHILPHSLSTITANMELNRSKNTALMILDMLDNGVRHLIEGPEIDRPLNALTLRSDLRREFGSFKAFFEAVPDEPHVYRINSTRRPGLKNKIFPVTRQFYLTPERTIDPPSPRLLAVHRAICLILHLSGAGSYVDRILRDMDGGAIQTDGSTHLDTIVRLKLEGWRSGA